MQITEKVLDRIIQAEQRYPMLKKYFESFIEGTKTFSSMRQLLGVKITIDSDKKFIDATFTTVKIRFIFHLCYKNDLLAGKVTCLMLSPTFTDEIKIIGTFTFNGQGTTDIEVKEGEDPIQIGYHPPEIILHFLNEAIKLS